VESDVLPAHEDAFNAWYDHEHLPGLAAVPGTVRAARYISAAGAPRYYACLDSLDTPRERGLVSGSRHNVELARPARVLQYAQNDVQPRELGSRRALCPIRLIDLETVCGAIAGAPARSRYTGLPYRGFEFLPLRQIK
jgi:hypothetical protein